MAAPLEVAEATSAACTYSASLFITWSAFSTDHKGYKKEKGGCGCDFSLHLNCIFVLFAAPFIKSLN